MQREDVMHNTPAQAREIVREAITIADEYTREDDEWTPIFRESVRLLSGKQVLLREDAPPVLQGIPLPGNLHGPGRGRR